MPRRFAATLIEVAILGGASLAAGFAANRFRTDPLPTALPASYFQVESGARPILLSAARRLYDEGSSLFIDARDPAEYEAGQVDGALNVPLDQWEEVYGELHSWVEGQRVVVYASSAQTSLADDVAGGLISKGSPRDSVYVFLGGYDAWREAGYPTRTGSDPVLGDDGSFPEGTTGGTDGDVMDEEEPAP